MLVFRLIALFIALWFTGLLVFYFVAMVLGKTTKIHAGNFVIPAFAWAVFYGTFLL